MGTISFFFADYHKLLDQWIGTEVALVDHDVAGTMWL